MLACEKKIRDNTPEIKPAGKLLPRGHGTKECMVIPEDKPTPDLAKHIRGALRPGVGEIWDTSCRTGDPPVDPEISHGKKTSSSLKARHLVNPPLKTKFEQAHLDLTEAHYFSSKNRPLGRSRDPADALPKGMEPQNTLFGKATERSHSIDELVAPKRTVQEIEEETKQGKELYKKSHNIWGVGEKIDRNYDWSKFSKDSLYGMETPHNNTGVLVSSALQWDQNVENIKVVSKRLDDFREKSQPQLATVHDPIADTLNVPPDFTFGIPVPIDRYGAGDMVNSETPSMYAECSSFHEGILMSIRNFLKKQKYHNFDNLLAAFQHKDKDKAGVVPAEVVQELAYQFRLPFTFDMLNMLIRWCTKQPEEGGVAYQDLVAMINWKEPLSKELLSQYGGEDARLTTATSEKLKLSSDYTTSSQLHKGDIGDIPTKEYRAYGVPTVRSDLAAPRLKRVSDRKNYGDEADGRGLMYPSIYSNHGVYEEDFFRPHPPEILREIFKNIGVQMSDEMFQEVWELAAKQNPKGEVCVETFRAVIEDLHMHITQQGYLQREDNTGEP